MSNESNLKENDAEADNASFYALLSLWSSRASFIAFGMVLPAVVGVVVDRQFGTVVLFAVLGVFLGMGIAFWQLIKFSRSV